MSASDEDVVLYQHGDAARSRRMLLLHGLANSANVWADYLEHAPPDHAVWTADLPWRAAAISGFADSYDRTTRAVLAAIEGVDDPGAREGKVIVAHSFSANLLLALLDREHRAGRDPLRRYGIDRLVLVSPFYRRSTDEFTWDSMAYFLNDFHLIMAEGLRVASRGRVSDGVLLDMAHRVRERVGPYGWFSFFDTYLRTPRLALDRLDVPCLVISGADDFAAHPSEAEALVADLPRASIDVVPDCGHFPMAIAPKRFANAVSGFLGDTDPVPRRELEMNV